MYRTFLGLAAAATLGLGLTGNASAHDHRDHRGHRPETRAYYNDHGHRFSGGYYYRGQHHNHWAHRVYDTRHGRYHYWDASLRVYYYWHPQRCCYYPIDYCP